MTSPPVMDDPITRLCCWFGWHDWHYDPVDHVSADPIATARQCTRCSAHEGFSEWMQRWV